MLSLACRIIECVSEYYIFCFKKTRKQKAKETKEEKIKTKKINAKKEK